MTSKATHARYGAAAFSGGSEKLPDVFPRQMAPRCMEYLREVVETGLECALVERFERAFAREIGVKHCVGTPGCTAALSILMAALGFEPGDEIIVSPITDYGTITGLLFENYVPVFCDTAPGTAHVTAETIAPCITERTRAILVVSFFGYTCDMDPILDLARERNVLVIEDACQSVFTEYRGRLSGTFGRAAAFSSDPEKTMGSDTGGALVTNDDELAERFRFMGQSRGAIQAAGFGRMHTHRGLSLRMSNCAAAISLAQLETIRDQVNKRDRTARLFHNMAAEIPGIVPTPIPEYCTRYSCWMQGFSLRPEAFRCTPDAFAAQLRERGLPNAGLGRYYLIPEAVTFLKKHVRENRYPFSVPPASRQYDYSAASVPNAKKFLENFIRWFWTEKYNEEHIEIICEMIRDVAAQNYA